MSDLLSYLYTVLTRIWDLISYPFEMAVKAVQFLENGWQYVNDILVFFPSWATASILLVFALGIVLFILKR